MTRYDTIYLLISGASTARRVPALVEELAGLETTLLTVLTPNSRRIISPREISMISGHQVVESYFDEAILPRPADGIVLVAPCSFNSLNKLAQGIADNLPLSIAAEAIGRGTPLIVAVSVNPPLWAHPRAQASVATLRSWGVHVIEPVTDDEGHTTMVENAVLVEAVRQALAQEHPEKRGVSPS